MIVNRRPYENVQLFKNSMQIYRVYKFKYLNITLYKIRDNDEKVNKHVTLARYIFFKFNTYLLRQEASLNLRLRVVKNYV